MSGGLYCTIFPREDREKDRVKQGTGGRGDHFGHDKNGGACWPNKGDMIYTRGDGTLLTKVRYITSSGWRSTFSTYLPSSWLGRVEGVALAYWFNSEVVSEDDEFAMKDLVGKLFGVAQQRITPGEPLKLQYNKDQIYCFLERGNKDYPSKLLAAVGRGGQLLRSRGLM